MFLRLLVATLTVASLQCQMQEPMCPKASEIAPCTCDREGISCFNAKSLEQFEATFKATSRRKAAKSVWLTGTPIHKIRSGTFNGYKVENYLLDMNADLSEIESGAFDGSEKTLTTLSVYKNALTTFPFEDLKKFEKLAQLSLASNQIKAIPSMAFSNVPSLAKIVLINNKIKTIGRGAFVGLKNLQVIDMSQNSIEVLGPNSMSTLSHAPIGINLGGNKIEQIFPTAFEHTEVGMLNLSSNSLKTLDARVFVPIIRFMASSGGGAILLDDNPFNCKGCDQWRWVVESKVTLSAFIRELHCKDGTTLEQMTLRSIGCQSGNWFDWSDWFGKSHGK